MRTLVAVLACCSVAATAHAQKPGSSSAPAPAAARPARSADPWVGTFAGEQLTVTLRRDGNGYRGEATAQGARYPVQGTVTGGLMIGMYTDGGVQYPFRAMVSGDMMELAAGDNVYRMQRQGSANGGALAGGNAGNSSANNGGAGGGSAQDRQLTQLLTRSAWCSFSYVSAGGSSGRSSTERVVFRQDGTATLTRGGESYYSGANGTVSGQSGGGESFRWRVQNGALVITDPNGASEAVPLTVTQNSNGYPIIGASGKEYSMCN